MASWIQENIELAPLTTFQVGGPARYFANALSEEHVLEALSIAEVRNLPLFILGGGSNIVVADRGFSGMVLRIGITGVSIQDGHNSGSVTVGAGEDWDSFVARCVDKDWAGIECLSGIPGSVGGTPIQNVGAYGQEASNVVTAVRVIDRCDGTVSELAARACQFDYRSSIFNTTSKDRYVVLSVSFKLEVTGNPALAYPDLRRYFEDAKRRPNLREVRHAVRQIRATKAMLLTPDDPDCRSAGSFFKNPILTQEAFRKVEEVARQQGLLGSGEVIPHFDAPGDRIKVPAAWLIENTGFHKGYQRGAVAISSKHALALINRGGATANDILALMTEILHKVRDRFSLTLQPEPTFVGFEIGETQGQP